MGRHKQSKYSGYENGDTLHEADCHELARLMVKHPRFFDINLDKANLKSKKQVTAIAVETFNRLASAKHRSVQACIDTDEIVVRSVFAEGVPQHLTPGTALAVIFGDILSRNRPRRLFH